MEKVNKIRGVKKDLANEEVKKKSQTEKVINLNKSKKSKTLKKKIKSPRTLWVRRKKRA